MKSASIKIRPFEWGRDEPHASVLIWEFWRNVFGEDLSEWQDVPILAGDIQAPMQKAEILLCRYMQSGRQILIARSGDTPVGVLVYMPVFAGVIAIHACFVRPEYEKHNVARKLVTKLKPKLLLFQTRTENPPERLHRLTEFRKIRLHKGSEFHTWSMNWGNDGLES